MDIHKIISNFEALPTIPGLARQLIELTANPQVDIHRISQLISLDQLLTLKVIRLSNSAHFSPATPVSSVQRAVSILGLSTVRFIIMGVAVADSIGKFPENEIISSDDFWLHALHCAVAAKMVAERLGYADPAEAYLVGLLHDIGKIPLIQHAYNTYLEVIVNMRLDMAEDLEDEIKLIETEKDILGFTHADISALLFFQWSLGEALSEVVSAHHQPQNFTHITNYPLACILYLANRLCYVESSVDSDQLYENLPPQVLALFQSLYPSFDHTILCDIILSVLPEFEACEDILDIFSP